MSFDGAKVRRFSDSRKLFEAIVCENSLFIDAGQINGEIMIFLDFWLKPTRLWIKMSTFAATITNYI